MTNLADVIRQVETVLSESCYPPTSQEREVYNRILMHISIQRKCTAEATGSW
jgi:hypothetical protein